MSPNFQNMFKKMSVSTLYVPESLCQQPRSLTIPEMNLLVSYGKLTLKFKTLPIINAKIIRLFLTHRVKSNYLLSTHTINHRIHRYIVILEIYIVCVEKLHSNAMFCLVGLTLLQTATARHYIHVITSVHWSNCHLQLRGMLNTLYSLL